MRKKLQVADLGDLLEQPLNAVLATYLPLGDILLTPVWHEWRGGGFSVIIIWLMISRIAICDATHGPVSLSRNMEASTAAW